MGAARPQRAAWGGRRRVVRLLLPGDRVVVLPSNRRTGSVVPASPGANSAVTPSRTLTAPLSISATIESACRSCPSPRDTLLRRWRESCRRCRCTCERCASARNPAMTVTGSNSHQSTRATLMATSARDVFAAAVTRPVTMARTDAPGRRGVPTSASTTCRAITRQRRHRKGRGQRSQCGEGRIRVDAGHQVPDRDGDERAKGVLREVEPDLHRCLPSYDDQRQCGADDTGKDQVRGREVEQADDERDLAEGKRMGLPTDGEVSDAGLSDSEADHQAEQGKGAVVCLPTTAGGAPGS